jgi:hypothetical protein
MLLESGIISRVLDRTSLGFSSYLVAFKIVSQVNDSRPTLQRVWVPLYPNVTQNLAIIITFLVGVDNYEARGKTFSDM